MKIRALVTMALLLIAALPTVSAPITLGYAAYSPSFGMLLFPDEATARNVAPLIARVMPCRFENPAACYALSQVISYAPYIVDDGK